MTTRWTPGPWETHVTADFLQVVSKEGLGTVVCDLGLAPASDWLESDAVETNGNARLISAAPDMAEALRRLLKWVEPIAGDNRDDAAEKEELASVEAARAALKKAGIQ